MSHSSQLSSLTAAILLAVPALASAQQAAIGGVIAGIVRDTANRPVAAADIIIRPGGHRARSDSSGRFLVSGLDADNYTVRARKLGFAPTDFEVGLSKAGRADITLVFDQRMPMLDAIVVTAGRTCSAYSLDGFVCRRKAGGGVFLDYTDIDDKDALYTADLFHDMKGFRTSLRSTRYGPVRYVQANPPWGCVAQLVDGRPATAATIIPELPSDLIAVEVYARPDSVPLEYQRYTWPNGNITKSGRCSVVAYWTLRARMQP
ncbi:MAG: carboxypeptidase-like regulatory domain-containing protein [bacterium]